jgi:imidazoleglycerol-phosphate dehydratase
MHIWVQYGDNDHHKVEAAFKSLALSLKEAVTINPKRGNIPSAKGTM